MPGSPSNHLLIGKEGKEQENIFTVQLPNLNQTVTHLKPVCPDVVQSHVDGVIYSVLFQGSLVNGVLTSLESRCERG